MTRHIRPWQLFSQLGDDHIVSYRIPAERGVDSETISSLDTLVLISVARIFKVATLLELGTGMGYTSYHLWRNTCVQVTTVDDDERRAIHLPMRDNRIERIIGDVDEVSTWNRTPPFDMIFYDVNIPGLTERCTERLLAANPRIMAWHDYGHSKVPHVKAYLDSLDLPIVHIEDSMMAFWFRDGFEETR